MIETRGLTKTFVSHVAVDALDLSIKEGEVFGFLGPNGAGKTTTVRMLAGLIAPTSGDASVGGYVVGRDDEEIRRIVGLLTETPGAYDRLTARQNLDFFAQLYNVPEDRRVQQIDRYLDLFGLAGRANEPISGFSKGMKQKLALARALIHEPRVIFLDEPSSGLDPESAKTVRDYIEDLRRQGRTIFLCTHNLDEAERLCDRIGIIKQRLLRVDTLERLRLSQAKRLIRIDLLGATQSLLPELADLGFSSQLEAPSAGQHTPSSLIVEVDNPERDNPVLIRRLVELGIGVVFVSEIEQSLEDIYLRLVRDGETA